MSHLTHSQSVPAARLRHVSFLAAGAVAAALAVTVPVVLIDGDDGSSPAAAVSIAPGGTPSAGIRYDGGPDEGTRGVAAVRHFGIRYDGGPDEGTRGVAAVRHFGIRYDGGPDEGSRGVGR